jgi:uncharacterized membrane protein
MARPVQWLRRTFITGFFVMVPLVVSVVAIVWVVQLADGLTAGLGEQLIGRHIPGLGLIATAVVILIAGATATNVFGRRVLQRGESLLLHVPLFRTVYQPVKQLISAFSPDNEFGFKRVVLIESADRGAVLGFLTKEFSIDVGQGPERRLAVYVPTNHLYLGDIVICRPEQAMFPDMSVQDGIRVFLTGGMALPPALRRQRL